MMSDKLSNAFIPFLMLTPGSEIEGVISTVPPPSSGGGICRAPPSASKRYLKRLSVFCKISTGQGNYLNGRNCLNWLVLRAKLCDNYSLLSIKAELCEIAHGYISCTLGLYRSNYSTVNHQSEAIHIFLTVIRPPFKSIPGSGWSAGSARRLSTGRVGFPSVLIPTLPLSPALCEPGLRAPGRVMFCFSAALRSPGRGATITARRGRKGDTIAGR